MKIVGKIFLLIRPRFFSLLGHNFFKTVQKEAKNHSSYSGGFFLKLLPKEFCYSDQKKFIKLLKTIKTMKKEFEVAAVVLGTH